MCVMKSSWGDGQTPSITMKRDPGRFCYCEPQSAPREPRWTNGGCPYGSFWVLMALEFLSIGFMASESLCVRFGQVFRKDLHARCQPVEVRHDVTFFVAAPIADFNLRRPHRFSSHALQISWRETSAVSGLQNPLMVSYARQWFKAVSRQASSDLCCH